jgi:hypothetical protein
MHNFSNKNDLIFHNGSVEDIRNELVGTTEFMCKAILPALVALRDSGRIELSSQTIGDHFELGSVIQMMDEAAFPELSREMRGSIARYLHALPGFNRELGQEQGNAAKGSHGFVLMQIKLYRDRENAV